MNEVNALTHERDELRAENQRLTSRAEHFENNWKTAEYVVRLRAAENERLRAEVDHLRSLNHEVGRCDCP